MQKLLLSLAACLMFMIAGGARLVVNLLEIPNSEECRELTETLDGIYYRGWKYEIDVFDCTNMSAYLHDFLMQKGYKCGIMTGISTYGLFHMSGGHAWLIAEKNGKKFWIESVLKEVSGPSYFDDYVVKMHFGSLMTAKIIFALFGRADEWNY